MKKTTYTKPEIKVVRLQSEKLMQAVSKVESNAGFSFDSDGLDDNDDLR